MVRAMVVLPNVTLTALVHVHPAPRDKWGVPQGDGAAAEERGPYPCAAHAQDLAQLGAGQEPAQWSLRLDPRMAPLRAGDQVTDGARVWTIAKARLISVPGAADADWITASGVLDTPEVG